MPPIAPATTTTTAFIGVSPTEGPFYEAQEITAALPGDSPLEQAVSQFFAGGARSAWIVRIPAENGDLAHALSALDAVASLNLIAMPDLATLASDAYAIALAQVVAYRVTRRALFFIVDPPADWTDVDAVTRGVSCVASVVGANGAIYWPLLTAGGAKTPISGAVAAAFVTTDESRGVWKAPAGLSASLPGVAPSYVVSDAENGLLNPLGVNVIREFANYGTVIWGARTLAGADALGSDWKYINVRRLLLFVEASIRDGLQWTATEPNTPALWSDITMFVTEFLTSLWKGGAFFGATPAQAFFIQCDATTTSVDDVENGLVNVHIGFAPVHPAEFVILQISVAALSSRA